MKHATDESMQKKGIKISHQDWRGNIFIIGPEKEEEALKEIVDDITSQIKTGLYDVIRGTRVLEKRKTLKGMGKRIEERQYLPIEDKPVLHWGERIRNFLHSFQDIKDYQVYEPQTLSEGLERQVIKAWFNSNENPVEIYIIVEANRKGDRWENLIIKLDGGEQPEKVHDTILHFWRKLMNSLYPISPEG